MATYNGEKFLKEQLDSILKQISPDDEVIISDDGSTDKTIEIIKSYIDTRIKLYHSTHKNLIYNFENALKQASGDIIFLSDQDDIWLDHKVATAVVHLQEHPFVFSNALIFKDDVFNTTELFFKNTKNKTGIVSNLVKVKYLGCTLAFKAELLEKALPFPLNIPMHDVWLGLIAEATASTYFIEKPLIYYRKHENNVSNSGGKSEYSLLKKIQFRVNLLYSLCKRLWFSN